MIINFKSKSLKRLFEKGDGSKIKTDHLRKVENILTRLHAAKELKDMNAPSLGLHKLKGDRKGQYAVTVKENWRIVFDFNDGDATNVEYTDYHQEKRVTKLTRE